MTITNRKKTVTQNIKPSQKPISDIGRYYIFAALKIRLI